MKNALESIARLETALTATDWISIAHENGLIRTMDLSIENLQEIRCAARKFLEWLKRKETQQREYIIISDAYPYHRHTTFNQAFKEANRLLSKDISKEFTILKVKATVENETLEENAA